MLKRLSHVRLVCIAAGVAVLLPPPLRADQADKRGIIRDARAAYYSLRRLGLESFEATMTPNWDAILSVSAIPAEQKAVTISIVSGMHFVVSYGVDGKTKVTTRADTPARNEQMQRGYDQIFSGMNQFVEGFYQTYSPFMVESPFPPVESEYTVDTIDIGYRVSYMEEGKASIVTRMTKTFAIVETVITTPEFDSVIKPTFVTTEQGYVLSAYSGYYKRKTDKDATLVDAKIEHRLMEGFRLPSKLVFDSSIGSAPNKTEVVFSNYIVKRR